MAAFVMDEDRFSLIFAEDVQSFAPLGLIAKFTPVPAPSIHQSIGARISPKNSILALPALVCNLQIGSPVCCCKGDALTVWTGEV